MSLCLANVGDFVAERERRSTYVAAVICLALVVLGYYYSPLPPAAEWWVPIINRGYSVFIILLGGAFVAFYKKRAFLDAERKSFFETIFPIRSTPSSRSIPAGK